MAAPKTVLTYPLDGAKKDFDIPFEYLARKFVSVTLLGTTRKTLTLNSDFRFISRTRITTTKAWGPADSFESVEIRRVTSATERLVDFADGSILRAYDLNTAQIQSLHIAEEARDLTADTIAVNNDGDLDARGKRLVNLADATLDSHAVTLRQEKSWAASTLSNKSASENARDAAKLSETNTKSSEDRAVTAETNAKKSEDIAKASAKVATDEIAKIDGQVDVAKGHADRAGLFDKSAEASAKASEVSSVNSGYQMRLSEAAAVEAKNSAKNASETGLQLGMSMWGYRPQPFKGFAVDDGQELDQSVYPSFVAALRSGLFPTTTEANWQAQPAVRGHFVIDSSPGKFRMRDLNGVQPGSIKGLFQRGDPGTSQVIPNVTPIGAPGILRDQLQDHRHMQSERFYGDQADAFNGGVPSADNLGAPGYSHGGQSLVGGANIPIKVTGMPTDKKVGAGGANFTEPNPARHGAETYPSHVTGAWMTRLFGIITPLGTAEASSLATAYSALVTRMNAIDSRLALPMKSVEEVLWTGGAGGDITVRLSAPLAKGDYIGLIHNDASEYSALATIPFRDGAGVAVGFSFGNTGYTGCYWNQGGDPAMFRILSYTSGYGVKKIYRIRQYIQ